MGERIHDPAEIEAVAIAGYFKNVLLPTAEEIQRFRASDAFPVWCKQADVQITALDAHRALAVWDAVIHFGNTCIEYGRHGDCRDTCPEFERMNKAQAALLAIFGAGEAA